MSVILNHFTRALNRSRHLKTEKISKPLETIRNLILRKFLSKIHTSHIEVQFRKLGKIALMGLIGTSLGCSSLEKTSLLGMTTGVSIGVIANETMNPESDSKSRMRSAGIGALVGIASGLLLHKVIKKKEDKVRRETLFNLEAHGIRQGFKPVVGSRYGNFVSNPHVREDYIKTHVTDDGRTLIQGHKIWKLIGHPQFNLPRNEEE